MDKIKLLLSRCKCGVHIQVNAHRDYYEPAKVHLENAEMGEPGSLNIPSEVREIMEKTNTVVSVVFYPDTPVGFYRIYHYDLETAIDLALSCLPSNTTYQQRDAAPTSDGTADAAPTKESSS